MTRGYYTLKILDNNLKSIKAEIKNKIIKELRGDSKDATYALKNNGKPEQDCKWYSLESDLQLLSKKYPDYIFKIEFVGTEGAYEPGDLYHEYYKNGKSQYCEAQIVYPKFDERFLE